jgi:hypothetical protein
MATDVIVVDHAIATASVCEDNNKYSALVGGITVTNGLSGPQGTALGTLGFLATINGATGPDNIALVSNNHVLRANGAKKDDTVYQPDLTGGGSTASNAVAKILDGPDRGDYPFQGQSYYVDAAAAQLKISISSCCHCNCGVSFGNTIRGLNVNGVNTIADVATAKKGDTVFKVGRQTSRTVGIVKKIDFSLSVMGLSITNAIEIEPLEPDCNGILRFSTEGDSGSAIVNDQGKLVGLLFSVATIQTNGLACHIAPVLDALKVSPITLANPPVNNPAFATSTVADAALMIDGRADQIQGLRERLLACPEGRRIWALVEQHRQEVVHLVNHDRRVAVAWHRNQGPAFTNRVINNARDPESSIPWEIAGVTREALLGNMGDVLAHQGSPALRAEIARHRDEGLAYAGQCDSLHEVVDLLSERQPV